MGFAGSKNSIDSLSKRMAITEEERQFIKDNFDSTICSANGAFCLKGCKFIEGKECQRLINKKTNK